MFGKKADVVNHYEKKLEKLERDMRLKQSLLAGEEVPATFVSFKTRHGASIASNIRQGIDRTQWLTETAPEPEDVHWPFFTALFVRRWISNVVLFVAFVALLIIYLFLVALVQGLANLHQLETWFPILKGVLNMQENCESSDYGISSKSNFIAFPYDSTTHYASTFLNARIHFS